MTAGEPLVQLAKVTKRYGDRSVLIDLSLDIAAGDVVALLGSSGCGKTTALRIIAGLETPDEGEVRIGGQCVSANGRNVVPASGRGIGFVFQDLALWPHLTVAGNLRFVLAASNVPKKLWGERIADALKLVRVERYTDAYPGRLSGGEQQRAAIARAIVTHPRLLLLDEPMSSLDTSLKADLLEELAALQKKLAITTVYITHDPAEAAALAHRVAIMQDGRIEQTGTVEELKQQLLQRSLLKHLGLVDETSGQRNA